MIEYKPIIKKAGFAPQPIAGKVPKWADGKINPNCIGTKSYDDFWEEQMYYCINGYTTGGIYLSGAYYHYLNFQIINGLHGPIYPDFVDLHYQMFKMVADVKKEGKVGIVIPKARRKGCTFVFTGIVDHGMRFIEGYKAGVAAGLETFVKGFRNKLYESYNNTSDEFKLNHLAKNKEELKLGYEESTAYGYQETITGHIQFKTMQDSSEKFEGEYFHDVICEEAGVFDNVDKLVTSVGPAMRIGEKVIGTIYVFGTGGNMLRGARGFKHIWHNAESLKFVKFFIPAFRYHPPYYVGAKDDHGKNIEKTDGLKKRFPKLKPEQLLGCEDVRPAEKSIRDERTRLSKNPDKRALIEHNQNYPLTVEEVFVSSGSNNFNSELLYGQGYEIDSLPMPKYTEHILEFVRDENGDMVTPLRVKQRAAKDSDKSYEIVKIYKHPKPGFRDLDVAGVDGYNEDKKTVMKSQGGIVVVRRNDRRKGDPNVEEPGRIPICTYYERPPRKEKHWEICLMIAVYYNLEHNMMISAESDSVIKYFKDMGAKKYLSPRPKAFDSKDTKQTHDFGVKMNSFSKPRMLGLLQTFVEDTTQYIWFPELINDLLAYDDENIGTDWDLADALGYALMRIEDMRRTPTKEDDGAPDPFAIRQWGVVNGQRVLVEGSEQQKDPWSKLPNSFHDNL